MAEIASSVGSDIKLPATDVRPLDTGGFGAFRDGDLVGGGQTEEDARLLVSDVVADATPEMTLEQKRALALAGARLRLKQTPDSVLGDPEPEGFQLIEIGGQEVEVPVGTSPKDLAAITEKFVASPEFNAQIDKESGAPARVRAIVGSAPEKDKLANLKQFYPDARAHGDGNFVYTDPGTGKPTLFNPEGLDLGDAAGFIREGVQTVSSALGAVGGGLLGGGVGVVGGPPGVVGGASGGAIIGAGAGSAVGAAAFDASMDVFTNRIDTRTALQRVGETALDFVGGAVGQRIGDIVGMGVKRAAGGVKQGGQALVRAFENLRIQPPGGAVTGSRAIGTVEKALESSPFSSPIMQESAERVLTQTKAAADRITAEFGRARSTQGAGAVIRDAARNAAKRFGFRQEEIYDKAFDLIGPDTPVVVKSITALRKAMANDLAQAPQALQKTLGPVIAQLRAIEEDAAEGLAFSALRAVRTNIGRDIATPTLSGSTGAQNEALKRVYGALTEDMSAAAQAAGPEAAKKLAVADRFTRQFMTTASKALEKINRLDSDEKAFNFAMSAAKDGGTGLARLRRHFLPEEWDTVAASVLGRMGRATPGAQNAVGDAFSPSTFLTNWNRMAPEAKDALFGGNRYKDLIPALNDLVNVTGSLKGVEALTNTSNTARNLIAYSVINTFGAALGGIAGGDVESAGAGALAAMAGTVVAPRVAARLMTNPSFVKWLTTPITSPNGIASHLGRLAGIALLEPELKEDLEQYVGAVRSIGGDDVEQGPDKGAENPRPE